MGETLTHKLIRSHLADGAMNPGDEIALGMDQALLQDATGTLAWLEFEQMRQDAVVIRQATQYVDHNILQTGYENADDHRFLRSVCQRYGAIFSGPGNGISHWAHMERFDMPGETMLGCDSHTPHAGACGMLAIGAGGFEVGSAMAVSPGSRQTLLLMLTSGLMTKLIKAGVRELEVACGPCIGMGFSPPTRGASVRTFNRNFEGRSGTADDLVYLCSPETAAATALEGKITDPRDLGKLPAFQEPTKYPVDTSGFEWPPKDRGSVPIVRGPNIGPLPVANPPKDTLEGDVLIRLGDNISTDHIMPAGGGFIVAGDNYGQGSSREHAAVAPMFLGVQLVLAKSFARIHLDNLVNSGIPPVTFANPKDYDGVQQGDRLRITNVLAAIRGRGEATAENVTRGTRLGLRVSLRPYQREVLLAGGGIRYAQSRVPR